MGPMSTWFFELVAPHYDPWAEALLVAQPRRVAELLPLAEDLQVLDVGGGTGLVAKALVEQHRARITVLDASQRMLARVPRHPRLRTVHGVAHSLPFHAATFDWVICTAAFHWFDPQEAALSAMWRVLKPGGRLYLQDLDPHGLAGPLFLQAEAWLKQGALFRTQAELATLLTNNGFSGKFFMFNPFQYGFLGEKQA